MKKHIILFVFMATLKSYSQKIIPFSIEDEVITALNYYPDLEDSHIEIRFKKNIKKSTMQARPSFGSFFRSSKNRKYVVLISEKFKISDTEFSTKDIPSDVLIGWVGHELGHIMDYQNRSKMNLLWFGLKYVFSANHIIEAERVADTYAVAKGMEAYILKTKNFILNHAEITPNYKLRMQRYYLSPEEIMVIVNERDGIVPEETMTAN